MSSYSDVVRSAISAFRRFFPEHIPLWFGLGHIAVESSFQPRQVGKRYGEMGLWDLFPQTIIDQGRSPSDPDLLSVDGNTREAAKMYARIERALERRFTFPSLDDKLFAMYTWFHIGGGDFLSEFADAKELTEDAMRVRLKRHPPGTRFATVGPDYDKLRREGTELMRRYDA